MTFRSRTGRGIAVRTAASVVAMLTVLGGCVVPQPTPTANFQVKTVFSGFTLPVAVRFAPDGRVFVAERTGKIIAYNSVNDRNGTVVVDLGPRVTTMWDRGLSGIELDPGFAAGRPYLYALYSLDAPIGGNPPTYLDDCIFEGTGNNGVCGITSGSLDRIEVDANNHMVSRTTLINDWCQQFGGHSVGDLEFAPDGSLFASGGDGANFEAIDWGQFHGNPCGDPLNEGGMLRAQDARTTGDPTGLDGTVIRIDPDTGAAWPTNPWATDPDPNRARIVSYGSRLPYRLNYDPAVDKLYIAEVGWGLWEELNVIDLSAPEPPNFGWPCFEGPDRQPGVDAADVAMCESLPSSEVTPPEYTYAHSDSLDPKCGNNGTSITGVAIVRNNSYPGQYRNGLYFVDYSRQCIFFVPRASDGSYTYAARSTFVSSARAVDLQVGPGGDLYFVDIATGELKRVISTGANHPPEARMTVDPTHGPVPLNVTFDGSASTDADPGEQATLVYEWDLDGDGDFDDATGANVTHEYSTPATINVGLRVTDAKGANSSVNSLIYVGNEPPQPVIDLPVPSTVNAGVEFQFSGHATDDEDGSIPASGLNWRFVIQHCVAAEACHAHEIASVDGTAGSSFEMPAHPAPSYLDVILTATDSGGAKASSTVRLEIGS